MRPNSHMVSKVKRAHSGRGLIDSVFPAISWCLTLLTGAGDSFGVRRQPEAAPNSYRWVGRRPFRDGDCEGFHPRPRN